MKILAIETSCDETAAAVIENGTKILSNVVVSQIDIHAAYGGVIPEVAARSHIETILPVIEKSLTDARLKIQNLDAIAVTDRPGLAGSLLIGTLTARTIALLHDKPLFSIHHLKSHIYANWLENKTKIEFPLLSLVVSGGHTQIIKMTSHTDFEIIGTTRDDAVGECFDKIAKILGLPYPGGPSISNTAKKGDENRYRLPHPKVAGLDFSFSGLKTAVLREVQKSVNKPISFPSHELKNLLTDQQKSDFAASFQKTAIDILLEKLEQALKQNPETKSILLAGGVSANQLLRSELEKRFLGSRLLNPQATAAGDFSLGAEKSRAKGGDKNSSLQIFVPDIKLSTDNAAMVGAAAYFEITNGALAADPYNLEISPTGSLPIH
jgi:N6-L-threonylcarbamoyladenine synthase